MTGRPGSTGDDGPAGDPTGTTPVTGASAASAATGTGQAIATDRDRVGAPVHRGWAAVGGHRWMEPFVIVLLAGGATHGYAIVRELALLGVTNGAVDVGQVYRTLRDLEEAGQVRSSWTTGTGPARRDYALTEAGRVALDEWAAVMTERARLLAEFQARYLELVAVRRR